MRDTICTERGWAVISKEIQPDHLLLFVSMPLAIAVADAVKVLKGIPARRLFQKFPALKRDQRDRHLALRRRLQSNGSQSAKQKLRQVSGKEMRRVKTLNHETSKAIVAATVQTGAAKIAMEDLTPIRDRIKAGKRMRARLHRWAWRQLQTFVEYKAGAVGMAVEYLHPAYTSQTCSCCGTLGKRAKHRFGCQQCGLRAHADLNASRNLARIGSGAPLPRAVVNTPDVGSVTVEIHVCASQ